MAQDKFEDFQPSVRIWVHHPTEVWTGAQIIEVVSKKELKYKLDDSADTKSLAIKKDYPLLRNPEILIGIYAMQLCIFWS